MDNFSNFSNISITTKHFNIIYIHSANFDGADCQEKVLLLLYNFDTRNSTIVHVLWYCEKFKSSLATCFYGNSSAS